MNNTTPTQDDFGFQTFCADVTQARLSALISTLEGERGVMLDLLREFLDVVQTIEPESEDEGLRLWALKIKTERLLTMAVMG